MEQQTSSVGEPVPRFRNAFEKLATQIRAVPASALVPITIDVPMAVASVLGALPEVEPLRPGMAGLPGLNLGLIAQVEDLALALGHTHGAWMAAAAPPRSLEELGTEAAQARDTLLADAEPLARRGLLDGGRLGEIGKRTGYRNIAFDLLALVSVFRERWSTISSKTAIALGELEQAEILADRLVTAVGERDQAPLTRGSAVEDRQKAFSLFMRAYNELRRAVVYLRFNEDDADEIVPSLYLNRKKKPPTRGAAAAEADSPSDEEDSPPPVATAEHATTAAAPAGMPGAKPFSN